MMAFSLMAPGFSDFVRGMIGGIVEKNWSFLFSRLRSNHIITAGNSVSVARVGTSNGNFYPFIIKGKKVIWTKERKRKKMVR